MSSTTPLEKAALRSHHLLPLVAIALIGCLGRCQYEPDDVSLPSATLPTTEPTNESSSLSATPVPSISLYHGRPGTSPLSEEEACAGMKATAELIWWTEEHETPYELRTMLEDLLRLSARAPDSIKQGIADYAEGNLNPKSRYCGTRAARPGQSWWTHAGCWALQPQAE